MAYFSSLPAEKQNKIYEALQAHVSQEAEALYNAALNKAVTIKQKNACAGQHIGQWYPLLEKWMSDRVTNIAVRDALRLGYVPEILAI